MVRSSHARLFGYGTFRHAAWRAAILGADYPAEPATLAGWRATVTPSGYFSIVPEMDAKLDGMAIELDAVGWVIADLWEEVPRYERVAVEIATAHGADTAYAYVCSEICEAEPSAQRRDRPVDATRFAMLGDDEVEAAIARFAPQMRSLRALDSGARGS